MSSIRALGVRWVRKLTFNFTRSQLVHRTFGFWQRLGVHVVETHYYQPIPDTRSLPRSLWEKDQDPPGIDLREEHQVNTLSGFTSRWGEEFHQLAAKDGEWIFSIDNGMFGPVDAEIYYSFIRENKPTNIVEVGAGHSTLLASAAIERNLSEDPADTCTLTAIEPEPIQQLTSIQVTLVRKKVEEIDPEFFQTLSENDILFIDSSHVSRIGGDVNHLLLEIVPRINLGVLVHFHDIFLPNEYPSDWVHRQHWFFTEQYLVQAFLAFNNSFELLWSSSLMASRHMDELRASIPSLAEVPKAQPGSLWIRRVA